MIIFGIDPGTAVTGYGVIKTNNNSVTWVDSGVITTNASSALADRLEFIYDNLEDKDAECMHLIGCVLKRRFMVRMFILHLYWAMPGVLRCWLQRKPGATVSEYAPREVKESGDW